MDEKFDVASVAATNDATPEEIQQIYDKFATTYDKVFQNKLTYYKVVNSFIRSSSIYLCDGSDAFLCIVYIYTLKCLYS